jgi:hypothetical protein
MDGTERMVAWLLWKLCHLTFDRYSEVLRPFELALRDFVYNLLDTGLPLDWREKLAAYLDEWAAKGAEFGPQERYDLALYVESRAVLEGRMPRDPNELGAATALESEAERSRREIHEGLATAPTFPLDPSTPNKIPLYEWWKYPDQKAPIASIEERKGIGAWYDEAVATGQHDPGFFERVAVSIVRSFFPDSEPTRVITRTDGKVEITISAGPTSGALAQQALAILGVRSAVASGRVTQEVVETVVDSAVQEATGSPVGPSVAIHFRRNHSGVIISKNRIESTHESISASAYRRQSVGELRAAGLTDAHHIIQDAAVRDLPGYDTALAPGIQLPGPSSARGTPHYAATIVQRESGGGTYAAERRIAYKAMRYAGVSEEDAKRAIADADEYFGSIGVLPNTKTRIPGNR